MTPEPKPIMLVVQEVYLMPDGTVTLRIAQMTQPFVAVTLTGGLDMSATAPQVFEKKATPTMVYPDLNPDDCDADE